MGQSKAWLPLGDETCLQRVVRQLLVLQLPVVVVAAAGQPLPELPPSVRLAYDRAVGRGPLEGLRAGIAAHGDGVEAVFATGCDAPLLKPAFVTQLASYLRDDISLVLPTDDQRQYPLAALYRVSAAAVIERLLAAGERRLRAVSEHVATRFVSAEELRRSDPQLQSLWNLNTPEDYRAALRHSRPRGLAGEGHD